MTQRKASKERRMRSHALLHLVARLIIMLVGVTALPIRPVWADGLFVSSFQSNNVLEYNGTTGAFVTTFASGGGLIKPFDLVFGPNGNLFVSSEGTNNVLEYNGTTGAFVTTFASGGGLTEPTYLTFSPASTVPEPASVLLLGSGLAVLAIWRRRPRS